MQTQLFMRQDGASGELCWYSGGSSIRKHLNATPHQGHRERLPICAAKLPTPLRPSDVRDTDSKTEAVRLDSNADTKGAPHSRAVTSEFPIHVRNRTRSDKHGVAFPTEIVGRDIAQ
jgi:hypothetical protein